MESLLESLLESCHGFLDSSLPPSHGILTEACHGFLTGAQHGFHGILTEACHGFFWISQHGFHGLGIHSFLFLDSNLESIFLFFGFQLFLF
jgi:hypothetical protein